MDLLKAINKRSFLSEFVYVALNLSLVAAVFASVLWFDSPSLGIVLVLMSKWRVFAVRPRFWFANIQANLVDTIVGFSAAVLIWQAGDALPLQIVLAAMYAAWLLVLKPRSKRRAVVLQAGVATFVGSAALLSAAYAWPVIAVVALMWLLGYATARHVLGNYDELEVSLLSMVWAVVVAELGWLVYHWTIAYVIIPGSIDFKVPQLSIILVALGYIAYRAYNLYYHKQQVTLRALGLPLMFVAGLLIMLLVFFTGLGTGNV